MNSSSNTYYTVIPVNPLESSWQPDAVINNKIHVDSGITSNWKYRQYIQNNANQIMKYNTMEYIYSSGNNPYTITDNIINDKVPHRFSSLYDTNVPNYESNNSDLKQDFVKKQQMSARMIAPSIATKYIA
jgi:hypothetical protein